MPFCTSHSSGIGSSASNFHALCPDSVKWEDGKRFGAGTSKEKIQEWLTETGIRIDDPKKKTGVMRIVKKITTSKTVSKLKADKKSYVRIRTYKTVTVQGKQKKIYSVWSKAKTIRTKK